MMLTDITKTTSATLFRQKIDSQEEFKDFDEDFVKQFILPVVAAPRRGNSGVSWDPRSQKIFEKYLKNIHAVL